MACEHSQYANTDRNVVITHLFPLHCKIRMGGPTRLDPKSLGKQLRAQLCCSCDTISGTILNREPI